jgi:hypothetical protein
VKNTNLILNEEQEGKLVEYALDRVESLKEDNSERIKRDALSWTTYQNSRQDRDSLDGIFSQSNVSVPLTSLVVDH